MNLKSKIKNLRYLLEAIIVKFGLWIFFIMGVRHASNIASKIAIFVGKKIAVQKLAYKNLSQALPCLSEVEKDKILDEMWDNLGRVVGEYPHVAAFSPEDLIAFTEIESSALENIAALKSTVKGGIIVSGHLANWELGPKILTKLGLKVSTVYRPLNNPYVEKMTSEIRGTELIAKGLQGSRRIIEVIKSGGCVIIMADQKISEGEPVKFFHDSAITTTSIARIALKYDIPVIPARIIRIGKEFKFRADLEKPLEIQRSQNINDDTLALTLEINRKLESWIRQYPAQWFWVHNRWKK